MYLRSLFGFVLLFELLRVLLSVCVLLCVFLCVSLFSATPEMNYSVTVSLVSGVGLRELSDLDKSHHPVRG